MTGDLRCPACHQPIERDAKFCGACGADVRPAAREPAGSDLPLVGSECPACHHKNQHTAKYCERCGTQMPGHLNITGGRTPVEGAVHPQVGTSPPGTCPSCGFKNLAGASLCERCNAKMWMPGPAASSTGAVAASSPTATGAVAPSRPAVVSGPSLYREQVRCERCGTYNKFGAPSCQECGLPFAHESAEGVPYAASRQGEPAGFWVRFVASLIDSVIVFGIGAVIWPLLFGETFWIRETSTFFNDDGVTVATRSGLRTQNWHTLMWVLYSIIFLALLGATPGKMIFNIRVYDGRGRRGIGFIRATVRTLSTFLSALTLLIGYIMAGIRRDKRALHDLIAGTYPTRKW